MRRRFVRILRLGAVGTIALGALATAPALAAHTDVTLRDVTGAAIDPGASTVPYSPKQTCGACHDDYDTITSAYHFQQGFDEAADDFNPDKPWVKSPGMYGKW